MSDLISRQAAIDAIYHHLPSVSRTRARTMLHEVPSVQPEPCEDAVSRTELSHIFAEHCYPVHYDHNSVDMGMTLPGIVEVLNIAPSVTPERKTGKWETVEDWDGDEHYRCSECGAEFVLIDGTPEDHDYYFCPHCGARMTKEDV